MTDLPPRSVMMVHDRAVHKIPDLIARAFILGISNNNDLPAMTCPLVATSINEVQSTSPIYDHRDF